MTDMIQFDLPKNQSSIIKVIGVGGGGSNAVNHMFKQGIEGVDFIVCNTDEQALDMSPVPTKVQIGASLTEGRGAGSIPAVGKNAAIENLDQLKALLEKNTKMLFITAGMGGGTGTGAAPVIAATAKEMGILTVAIVTIPFMFEGRKRRLQADEGIRELRKNVDTLLVICNDKLRELFGNLCLSEAFGRADNILTTAAKGIAEIITVPGYINVDFEDVKTVMKNSGVAIMGSGFAEGENRALNAVEMALSSPLLNDNQIKGASNILLYIASGIEEIRMDEVSEITEYIQRESGSSAEIIWGNGTDETLGNKVGVTLIATGFDSVEAFEYTPLVKQKEKIVTPLDQEKPAERIIAPPVIEKVNYTDFKLTIKEKDQVTDNHSVDHNEPNEVLFEIENTIDSNDKPLFEFEKNVLNEPVILTKTDDNKEIYKPIERIDRNESTPDEVLRKSQERIKKLRELSMKIKTAQGLSELEKEPAYLRKNVVLAEVTPSSESHISRYTLSEDENKRVELKQNNSFLHDNVD
ncbi:MAG TPA: cell division protein FtsZ [Bacteroidales bacterium]|nr:cell division protein FtsZ [Bacteroidales bacterium]